MKKFSDKKSNAAEQSESPQGQLVAPEDFDPVEYLLLNEDVGLSQVNPTEHFVSFGRQEGRLYKAGNFFTGDKTFQPGLKTCLLITHDLAISGSPMLALNLAENFNGKVNLIILSFTNSGRLLKAFSKNSFELFLFDTNPKNEGIADLVLARITKKFKVDFAIANSSVTRRVLAPLKRAGIPAISLIHEFASAAPKGAVIESILNSQATVFSAKATYEDARGFLKLDSDSKFPIVYQGINSHEEIDRDLSSVIAEQERIDNHFDSTKFNVVGIGSILLTKGVDLFISVSQELERRMPGKFQFTWVGPLSELENSDFGFFLKDASKRSVYLQNFSFFEVTPEINFLFEKIDCFALTSRLDTMASVAIEAMASAKPVIAFQGTGGIPDLITDFGFKEQCVAEYLNVTEFAEKIQKLESDPHFKAEVGTALRNLAMSTFDSNKYASKILAICDEATKQFKN